MNFLLPGQARAEAQRLLALLMTPPAAAEDETTGTTAHGDSGLCGVNRRALLFDRRNT